MLVSVGRSVRLPYASFVFRCGVAVRQLSSELFFFKQKTAYEMRISDWSSDVCSSDHAWSKFRRSHSAMLGAAIVILFVLLALLAPWIASYDPVQVSFTAIRKAPSAAHWFGTDELGRDIFSRMVFGARASLMAGMFSVLMDRKSVV